MLHFYLKPGLVFLVLFGSPVACLVWLCRILSRRGTPLARACILVLAATSVALVAVGCMLYSAYLSAAWEAHISRARSRAYSIGLALKEYSRRHRGRLPPRRSWASSLMKDGLVSHPRFFYLGVPLGSDDVSRFPETDFEYGGGGEPREVSIRRVGSRFVGMDTGSRARSAGCRLPV